MTDRELLELAAKAVGMSDMKYMGGSGLGRMLDPSRPEDTGTVGAAWNPLTDDGDALRLAVKLGIAPRSINGVAFAWADGVCDVQEPHGTAPYAATRRAIVRAAAEVGRTKP